MNIPKPMKHADISNRMANQNQIIFQLMKADYLIFDITVVIHGKFSMYWRIIDEKWKIRPLIFRFLLSAYAHLQID
jgi:hypothetical protein